MVFENGKQYYSVSELGAATLKAWDQILTFKNLAKSFQNSLLEVIRVKGNTRSTKNFNAIHLICI